jgi:hypothetical protein
MDAQVGDRLVVNSRHVGQPAHTGEIVEVIGSGGEEHYRVRWTDGRETVVFPGTDTRVERVTSGGDPAALETRTVTIQLRLEEDSDNCEAVATMSTSTATFTGSGRARRNPADPVVPMIAEELAIARSLGDLAAKLEAAAGEAIAAGESRRLHLVP